MLARIALLTATAALCLTGCSAVQDALDYGRGPFDHSPATTSEAALEGLHESSWGNSGRWGGQGALEDGLKEDVPEPDQVQTTDARPQEQEDGGSEEDRTSEPRAAL
ncbi:MAG: hypothetical protein QNI87_05420 [Erythrobacter sp.]|uniref:hypothetical protein n=1 Tax=Erythrobacter sp. TaxID=1042 RepID=UPI0026306F69|nr:hypothetical protein [Erythrobacter sp.]MDJ0977957.1 hypothetical protein [Erythrobacter sp.]